MNQAPVGRAFRVLRASSLPLIAAGLLVLLAALLELVLRLGGWAEPAGGGLALAGDALPEATATLPDRDLFYRLRPSATLPGGYVVNRHGWRGPEHDEVRRPGTLRVICTGDSNTFGLAVRDDETWPELLRRTLGALLDGCLDVEVVNAGVPGYSTEETVRQVRRDLLALAPDVLVVCPTAHNDVAACDFGGDRAALDGWAARLSRLRVAQLLGLGQRGGASPAGPGAAGDRPRVLPEEFAENLRLIAALARGQGVPVVYVVTPHATERTLLQPALNESEELVARAGQQAGALVADARPGFEDDRGEPLFCDGIHFVPLGHRLVALAVARAIAAQVPLPATGARSGFLRCWAAPGSRAEAGGPADENGPPRYRELLASLQQPDIDARLASGDPGLPEALRRFDPLFGSECPPFGTAALVLDEREARTAGRTDEALALEARRLEIERFVRPFDALVVRCGGPARLAVLPRDELARERALVVFDREAGLWPPAHDRRLGQARAALGRGEAARALDLLDAVVALYPGQDEAHYLRALALRRLDRREESDAALAALEAAAPQSPLALFVSGTLARERGELDRAADELGRALQADPSLSIARVELARLAVQRGDLTAAESLLQPAFGAALVSEEAAVLRAEITRLRGQP